MDAFPPSSALRVLAFDSISTARASAARPTHSVVPLGTGVLVFPLPSSNCSSQAALN